MAILRLGHSGYYGLGPRSSIFEKPEDGSSCDFNDWALMSGLAGPGGGEWEILNFIFYILNVYNQTVSWFGALMSGLAGPGGGEWDILNFIFYILNVYNQTVSWFWALMSGLAGPGGEAVWADPKGGP
jgi:hypothetical protein